MRGEKFSDNVNKRSNGSATESELINLRDIFDNYH